MSCELLSEPGLSESELSEPELSEPGFTGLEDFEEIIYLKAFLYFQNQGSDDYTSPEAI